MTASNQYFQFTLGPVQGFVAQARRTRDFWAGSFILSWLSSVAMEAIKAQGGEIRFPQPDASYLAVLKGEGRDADYPQQGCIPNRFSATTAQVPQDFQPEWVTRAVQHAWQALADMVWSHDLEEFASKSRTRWPEVAKIWQRQVAGFWEMTWVLSEQDEPSLLDRRKNWRNQATPNETGHKCMMMDGWQELSGETRTNMAHVREFWSSLQNSGAPGIRTDLRAGEQLCAIAYIKRRFARYFEQVEVTLPAQDVRVYGWPVPYAVPSVSFIAAAPWIAQLVEHGSLSAWEQFQQASGAITGLSEVAHVGTGTSKRVQRPSAEVRCVAKAAARRTQVEAAFNPDWAGLDGQVYYRTQLENVRIFDAPKDQVSAVQRALNSLTSSAGLTSAPSPFYAILLMDGDQLGKHMGTTALRPKISNALNAFTQGVAEHVRSHDGFLVYAGGDDVLAMLPMEQALSAAARIQAFYKDCFAQHCPQVPSTLSGAIEYAHIRTPLTQVLQDAHGLLDNVAKDAVGRDAIACRVWKPSGIALTWAMPWTKALDAQGQPIITGLAQIYGRDLGNADKASFSASFFHRTKEVLERFSDAPEHVLRQLVKAEYVHSWGATRKGSPDAAKLDALDTLLSQCWCWSRPHAEAALTVTRPHPMNPDAALLVRFLAQAGQEREWQ